MLTLIETLPAGRTKALAADATLKEVDMYSKSGFGGASEAKRYMAIKVFGLMCISIFFVNSIMAEELRERLSCDAYAEKFASGEEISVYATDAIGLEGPYFMGSSSDLSFMFCTADPKDCGARMCPGDIYMIDRDKKRYEKLFSSWGSNLSGVQLSPGGRYLAFNSGYSHGSVVGGRYLEVWDLKTKEQLPTPAFYQGDDKPWFSLIAMEWIGPEKLKIEVEEMRMPALNEGDDGVQVAAKFEILNFSQKVGREK